MEITRYENWMKEQVLEMFIQQYPEQRNTFPAFFENLYEYPEQKRYPLRAVALDGKKVIGFQSFFSWPYVKAGKSYNTYQSGNSLVSPDYRGKGIFQKLLDFVYTWAKEEHVDFLVGFPVPMSLPSFKKNGWTHLMDLRWYVCVIQPIPLGTKTAFRNPSIFKDEPRHDADSITRNKDWVLDAEPKWRKWKASLHPRKLFYFEGPQGNNFELKINRRLSLLNEVIIGDIRITNTQGIGSDIKALKKALLREGNVNLCSLALNEANPLLTEQLLTYTRMRQTKKGIHFIIKPINIDISEINKLEDWRIYRGDLDTW